MRTFYDSVLVIFSIFRTPGLREYTITLIAFCVGGDRVILSRVYPLDAFDRGPIVPLPIRPFIIFKYVRSVPFCPLY